MIIEKMGELSTWFLEFIFSIIPKVPDLPQSLHDKLFEFIDIIFTNGTNILSLFIRIDTIKIVVPILLIIINLDKIYNCLMWVLRKIPVLGLD